MQRLAMIVATGFGLGYSPIVPGTVGSLPGLVLAFSLSFTGIPVQLVVAVLLSLMAIPVCSAAEARFGTKDDRRIVADEYLTFPICMIGLPWNLWLVAVAFVVSRLLDVIKPPPARQIQAIKGGTGIVLDDVISNCFALGLNHALWWLVLKPVLAP